jgi:hypothetical protein
MANVSHSTLTDPYLHEPKGVAAAAAGYTYRSDGAGSGAWEKIQGFSHYKDDRITVGTPVQTIATTVRTQLLCNGGALSLENQPSDATVSMWNTTTNKHVPISENDVYDIRIGFSAENYSGTDPYIRCELDVGGSLGVIWAQTIPLLKGGNEQACSFSFPVYTGSTYITNGGTVYLTYVGTAPCVIFDNQILVHRTSRLT